MPKFARLIVPDCPHHVIQRGNRRQKVFFSDEDRELYLKLIKRQADRAGVLVHAYCLMDNHVHIIAVPKEKSSLAKGIGEAHRKYTNIINIREDWKGYLWQGRFISFPLDEAHYYAAVRYVERNPVRAGIAKTPWDYPWSSARAHLQGEGDAIILQNHNPLCIQDWRSYLTERDDPEFVNEIERHEKTGRPLGSVDFLRKLESLTGRKILPQPPGRKKGNRYCVSNLPTAQLPLPQGKK
jgi:putative transposase